MEMDSSIYGLTAAVILTCLLIACQVIKGICRRKLKRKEEAGSSPMT